MSCQKLPTQRSDHYKSILTSRFRSNVIPILFFPTISINYLNLFICPYLACIIVLGLVFTKALKPTCSFVIMKMEKSCSFQLYIYIYLFIFLFFFPYQQLLSIQLAHKERTIMHDYDNFKLLFLMSISTNHLIPVHIRTVHSTFS